MRLEDSDHLRTLRSIEERAGVGGSEWRSERSRRPGILRLRGWPLSAVPVGRTSRTCWTRPGREQEAAEDMVGSETWEVKSRGGRGQRRSSWRMLVRTQGTEMGPSQRPPPPGSPGRGTRASTVRGVGSVPSGISCLILEDGPCTLRFSLTPPGRSVPSTAATWGLGGGRGARLGPGWDREDAGQHVEAELKGRRLALSSITYHLLGGRVDVRSDCHAAPPLFLAK